MSEASREIIARVSDLLVSGLDGVRSDSYTIFSYHLGISLAMAKALPAGGEASFIQILPRIIDAYSERGGRYLPHIPLGRMFSQDAYSIEGYTRSCVLVEMSKRFCPALPGHIRALANKDDLAGVLSSLGNACSASNICTISAWVLGLCYARSTAGKSLEISYNYFLGRDGRMSVPILENETFLTIVYELVKVFRIALMDYSMCEREYAIFGDRWTSKFSSALAGLVSRP
ncbi:MAG: hypothetical protein QXT45_07955 [Candidatus Bilamarchaeaceae archaeon]